MLCTLKRALAVEMGAPARMMAFMTFISRNRMPGAASTDGKIWKIQNRILQAHGLGFRNRQTHRATLQRLGLKDVAEEMVRRGLSRS
jgi:hypothetical protein